MNRIRKAKGFTLIELIVVIVIIGILAAIAAVAYNQFIDNAKDKAALAEASDKAKVIQADSALANAVPDYSGISVAAHGSTHATCAVATADAGKVAAPAVCVIG